MGMESVYKLSVLVNMIDQMSGPSARVQKSLDATSGGFQNYTNKLGEIARNGTALIGVGQSVTQATLAPVKSIFGTQDALAELSSLGIEDLGRLEQASADFSKTWAGTTKPQFLTAAYDIKSGIASLSDDGVANMTRIAGVTAKATKSTIDEMTNLFATGYGIYKDYYGAMSDEAFGEMFSAGIAKSVQQFKTTGSGMAQAISALGGSATAANVPMEEQLSILGMLQATMSGSEAGTKYTAFLQSAGKAGQELGLKFTDTNGQLKSMPEILGAIKGKFGETMTAADKLELQKAFGTIEAVKLIDLLYGKTDDLQGNILTLYDTMGQGMSITTEMANKINAPPGQSWELLHQKMMAMFEMIGNTMLPTFTEMQNQLSKVADWVVAVAEKHPNLISNIMYAVMAFGAMFTVIGTLKLVFGGLGTLIVGGIKLFTGFQKALDAVKYAGFVVKYGFFLLKGAFMSMLPALSGVIASVWSFTAALLANPITWVVVGIIAFIAAIVALWMNWDKVVAAFQRGFETIRGWFSGLPGWVQAAITIFMPFIGIPLQIIKNWDGIKAFFANLIENIKSFFAGLPEWFKNEGVNLIKSFGEGILSVITDPVGAVKGALGKIREMMPFSDAKTGPLSDLTLSGQRVFTTFNDGMMQTADLPAQTVEGAFAKADDAAALEPGTDNTGKGRGQTIIQKVVLYVKPEDIKDLQKLKKLLEQMDDINNSYPDPVPEV